MRRWIGYTKVNKYTGAKVCIRNRAVILTYYILNSKDGGKTMSKLKKRELERKGEKKRKIQENKLLDEHLVDLTKTKGELEELPEEI